MNTLINLFLIAIITTFIVDLSGAIDSLKSGIKWVLTKGKFKHSDYRLLPLDCSLCMTFWTGLIYLLCVGKFTILYVTIVCLLAFCTDRIGEGLVLFKDLILKIFRLIREFSKI